LERSDYLGFENHHPTFSPNTGTTGVWGEGVGGGYNLPQVVEYNNLGLL